MSLNALLHLWYAQHVSATCMPIIRSSRLYVCYYRLWCAVLGCLSRVRSRAAGCESSKRDAARLVVQRPSSWTHIVSSSWWWAYKYPKHVERIIHAIKHSVTSSWFFFSTQIFTCLNLGTNCANWSLHLRPANQSTIHIFPFAKILQTHGQLRKYK